ncbi:NUDIX domain-containing protein [Candidatus Woesearchaeota archaeon]|nr:NUDIX domain-containing protein [Candidatus Woesearchaeota archaeon]
METITIVDGVIIKNNKILLLKKFTKNYYEFPGGKIKKRESPTDCLKRELKEEIGILPVKYKEIAKLSMEFENKKITDYGFLIEEYEEEPEIKEKEIFEELIWIKPEEIETIKTAPNVKQILRKLS